MDIGNHKFRSQSAGDKAFDIINHLLLILITIAVFYPLYFIVIASFSDPAAVSAGNVHFLPKGFNLDGYIKVFENRKIWTGYGNSILYTVVGTLINLTFTITAAYGLSKKTLPGQGLLMGLITFTMFFSGGLIPSYLLIDKLGINNTMWALVLPGAVSVYNLIIARSYMSENISGELEEAAKLDGCSDFNLFLKIALPLSKPIIGVVVLMYAVGHWNEYFNALIYLRDQSLYPLQVILRDLLIQTEQAANMGGDSSVMELQKIADMLKYGVIVVSSLPVLCIYPFIQKYFAQGMMIGSVKG